MIDERVRLEYENVLMRAGFTELVMFAEWIAKVDISVRVVTGGAGVMEEFMAMYRRYRKAGEPVTPESLMAVFERIKEEAEKKRTNKRS